MKFRSGLKLAIAVGIILGLFFLGNRLYTVYVILPRVYPRLTPGHVNLIGIKLQGERIIVSNGIARLEQGAGEAFGGDSTADALQEASGEGAVGASSGATIPMFAVIGALQQKPEETAELVSSLAGIDTANIPDERLVWNLKDIQTALSSPGELRNRLERDLCQRLDGELLAEFHKSRLRSGIYLRIPVPVEVPTDEGVKIVSAPVVVNFKTRLADRVNANPQIRGKYDPSDATWRGVYEEVGEALRQSKSQSPREQIQTEISADRIERLAGPASRLLARVTILATESQIARAALESKPKPNGSGTISTLNLDLTRDGRDRLWQYTFKNPGCQLLFAFDGIAIAAPFVKSEMKYSTIAITNVTDEVTATEATEWINTRKQ